MTLTKPIQTQLIHKNPIQTQPIQTLSIRYKTYTRQNLYMTEPVNDKTYTKTKPIRDKTYTDKSSMCSFAVKMIMQSEE